MHSGVLVLWFFNTPLLPLLHHYGLPKAAGDVMVLFP
jgi:hypothetical protein